MLSTKMDISPRVALSEVSQCLRRALEQAQRLQIGVAHVAAQKDACQVRLAMTVDPAVFTESWLNYQSLDAYGERMTDRRDQLHQELKAALAEVDAVLPTVEQERDRLVEALQDAKDPNHFRQLQDESNLRSAMALAGRDGGHPDVGGVGGRRCRE
jgi:hypothetical protein